MWCLAYEGFTLIKIVQQTPVKLGLLLVMVEPLVLWNKLQIFRALAADNGRDSSSAVASHGGEGMVGMVADGTWPGAHWEITCVGWS